MCIYKFHVYMYITYCVLYIMQHVTCVLSHFSHVQLFATLWIVVHQAPLSVRFSRQEYWSGLPCPPPRDLLNPGIGPKSLMSPALAAGFFTTSTTWEAQHVTYETLYIYIKCSITIPLKCA